jgi:TolA-binding protein
LAAVEKLLAALKKESAKKASAPVRKVVVKVDTPKKEGVVTPQVKADESSRGLYRAGREALRDRRYGRSRELMERWIALYGKKAGKRSALDDAYVAVGESWQNQKKFQKAIHAYKRVYKMGSSKADMWTKAVFRMGECFQALGDKAGARAFYKIASSKGRGGFSKKSAQRLKRLR